MEEKIKAWIARDENGEIYIYTTEPRKLKRQWEVIDKGFDKNKFQQVKWEDTEPTKVELTIKIYK